MYDIILQNNASKQEWAVTGLTDSGNAMAYVFENFSMPADAPDGEYTGALIFNGREDVQYEFNDVLLDTLVKTEEGDVRLRDLRPEIFLLRYGVPQEANVYRKENKNYYYKSK